MGCGCNNFGCGSSWIIILIIILLLCGGCGGGCGNIAAAVANIKFIEVSKRKLRHLFVIKKAVQKAINFFCFTQNLKIYCTSLLTNQVSLLN